MWQADTLQRRMFYVPSFKIYGAVAGFYDYGPPGCAVKQNLTALWRKHFVLEENMLEARGHRLAPCACPSDLVCLFLGSCRPPGLACCMHGDWVLTASMHATAAYLRAVCWHMYSVQLCLH